MSLYGYEGFEALVSVVIQYLVYERFIVTLCISLEMR